MKTRIVYFSLLVLLLSACAQTATPGTPAPTSTSVLPTYTPIPTGVSPIFTSPLTTPTPPAQPDPGTSPLPGPTPTPEIDSQTPRYTYRVINTYPHDPGAFTQGLVYLDGVLYEGTGLHGASSLRRVDLETGQVWQQYDLPGEYFGEGIAILNDKIYQLTWQSQTGFVYDLTTFELLDQFTYPSEGWGLTHDGTRLIMSDGTATLYFLDPQTLKFTGQVLVHDGPNSIARLNELEYVEGQVWANVWQTDWIARIDPDSGQVLGWIDLNGLLAPEDRTQPVDVLNGIAYDAVGKRILVTGKWWPRLFEIEILPQE